MTEYNIPFKQIELSGNLEERLQFYTFLLNPESAGLTYFALPIDNNKFNLTKNYLLIPIYYAYGVGSKINHN